MVYSWTLEIEHLTLDVVSKWLMKMQNVIRCGEIQRSISNGRTVFCDSFPFYWTLEIEYLKLDITFRSSK